MQKCPRILNFGVLLNFIQFKDHFFNNWVNDLEMDHEDRMRGL